MKINTFTAIVVGCFLPAPAIACSGTKTSNLSVSSSTTSLIFEGTESSENRQSEALIQIEFEMPSNSAAFVLWDNAVLPLLVSGEVAVIDYLGNENTKEAIEVSGSSPRMIIVGPRP